ncbi:MAG: indolepyruvate oxidoreductase subunit beta [Deltaproteobacteria bacterium]|nr:indolepyruvate oxidoreductase subunit beta [Deltaproteobacteria bacterium]
MDKSGNNVESILLAGVGGQGIIRASDILCMVAVAAGLDVKKSEVHGMAQRGGCVTSHVRYGEKVYSPLARKGDVDLLVSFEKLETLRYLDYLKKAGAVIANMEELYPPSVNTGDAAYPDSIDAELRQRCRSVKLVDAGKIAKAAGNIRTVNTVLLGVLAPYLDFEIDLWKKILQEAFPAKILDENLKAFDLGRKG